MEGAVDKGHSVGGLMRTPLFRCPGLATRTGGPPFPVGRENAQKRPASLDRHVTGRSGVAGLDPFVRIALHLLVGLASLEPSPPWFAHWAREDMQSAIAPSERRDSAGNVARIDARARRGNNRQRFDLNSHNTGRQRHERYYLLGRTCRRNWHHSVILRLALSTTVHRRRRTAGRSGRNGHGYISLVTSPALKGSATILLRPRDG